MVEEDARTVVGCKWETADYGRRGIVDVNVGEGGKARKHRHGRQG